MENFQTYMRSFQLRSPQWVDWFPVQEELLDEYIECRESSSSDATDGHLNVLLVDVAGGSGQHISLFQERFPNVSGRLVLQDLPTALKACKHPNTQAVETLEYDLFTPQITKGKSIVIHTTHD